MWTRVNEMPTRCNRWFFIAKLIVCSTCFGYHYAHHQELKSIIRVVDACGAWCCKDVKIYCFMLDSIHVFWVLSIMCCTGLLWACRVPWVFCGPLWWVAREFWIFRVCGSGIPFELLMMGIMVPETRWANNKFCNKEPSVASSWHFISTY
jgi:hypothetical protein